MGAVGNAVKHTFGNRVRRGASLPGSGPVAFNGAEKRSDTVELGDLKQGRLHLIVGDSSSGQPVNETSAQGVPAVMACVTLLADMVSKLPIHLYRKSGRVPEEIDEHPALYALNHPGDLHTGFELRHMMEVGRGLGGNGYARVYRDQFGQPQEIEWIKPVDIEPNLVKRQGGADMIVYNLRDERDPLTRFDIIHVKGVSTNGIKGQSPIQTLRESIGTSLSQTRAAGKLMRNGAKWPGIITVEGVKDPEKLADIRDEINSNLAGTLNAGRIPVVGGGLTWQQTNGMSMVDAEFVESRRFELQEIARHYRIPSFLIGDSTSSTTWGTGIEQQTLGFLNFCLDPHLCRWEQALNATLLTTEELRQGYCFEFDRDELINASMQARGEFYSKMRTIGVYSPNDVRAKLGEALIPADQGGDDYGKPLNSNATQSSGGATEGNPAPATVENDED